MAAVVRGFAGLGKGLCDDGGVGMAGLLMYGGDAVADIGAVTQLGGLTDCRTSWVRIVGAGASLPGEGDMGLIWDVGKIRQNCCERGNVIGPFRAPLSPGVFFFFWHHFQDVLVDPLDQEMQCFPSQQSSFVPSAPYTGIQTLPNLKQSHRLEITLDPQLRHFVHGLNLKIDRLLHCWLRPRHVHGIPHYLDHLGICEPAHLLGQQQVVRHPALVHVCRAIA